MLSKFSLKKSASFLKNRMQDYRFLCLNLVSHGLDISEDNQDQTQTEIPLSVGSQTVRSPSGQVKYAVTNDVESIQLLLVHIAMKCVAALYCISGEFESCDIL